MKRSILYVILFSNISSYAQNIDSSLVYKYKRKAWELYVADSQYDSIMFYLDEMGHIAYRNRLWEPYIYSMLARCNVSNTLQDYEAMKCFAFRSLHDGGKLLENQHEYHSAILGNLSGYYNFIGEDVEAISLMTESIDLLIDLPSNTERFDELLISFLNLGNYWGNIGETQKSISCYNQVLSLAYDSLAKIPFLSERISTANYSIALEKKATREFDQAISFYSKNIKFIKKHDPNNIYALLENYISLANSQRNLHKWDKCNLSLKKAKYYQELHKKKFGFGAKEINFFNVNAKYLADIGLYKEALESGEHGLMVSKKINGIQKKNYSNGDLLKTIGETYAKQNKWIKAIESFDKSIFQNSDLKFYSNNIYENQVEQDFQVISPFLMRIVILKINGFVNLYKKSNLRKDLLAGFNTSQLLIQLADRYRHQLDTQGSQLFISTELKPAYEQAIEIALELYEITKEETYLEEAFKISEKSKAVLLSNALTNTNAKYTGGIPDSLMSQERELLANISFYKKQVFEEKNKTDGPNEALINQWERKLFELDREKDAFDKQLEKNYPLYYQHKNQTEKISLLEIQKELDSQTELIEYFAGDSTLYVFNLNKEGINYKRIENPASLYKRILSFSQGLADVNNQAQNIAVFTKQSYFLNQELIGEKRASVNKYIIIPDGILGRLPFELLIPDSSANKNYTRLPYLFTSHEIQYAYSALLLYKDPLKRTYEQAKASWVGFAPSFEKGKRLVYNQEEVETIQTKMNGISYSGQSADLKTFLAQAENFQIIHLATHGYADVENSPFSRLEFTYKDSLNDGILYAHELANQRLKAELVVLSACETGHGSIAKGEGIMSLAWSFRYAGVPSILMSLWKAESNVTKQLMSHFYTHLEAGKSKSESIRLAKLNYLDDPIPGKEHPRYWANFVLIGDGEPLSRNFSMWWVFATLSVLIFAILYQFQRNTRSKTNWV